MPGTETETKEKTTAVATTKQTVVDLVAGKVRTWQDNKQIALPTDYSVENAMKSAWLILQETLDKDKRPALDVCTQNSIANALLSMAVQGLNPDKDQCYFIVYANKLACMRSYFGTMAVCQRVANARDIVAEVVYQGDKFEYEIIGSRRKITKHVQKLENINPDKIVAAYCIVEFEPTANKEKYVDIMTWAQIQKSWSKSRMHSDDVQKDFPDEMARRTIINRACKALINASSDKNLLKFIKRTDEEASEAEVAADIAADANTGEIIDVEATVVTEEKPMEKKSDKPKKCCVCGTTEGDISQDEHGDWKCAACFTGKKKEESHVRPF